MDSYVDEEDDIVEEQSRKFGGIPCFLICRGCDCYKDGCDSKAVRRPEGRLQSPFLFYRNG